MQRGDWYKAFTASESTINTKEIYYHIVDVAEDEELLIDEYTYYPVLRKYAKASAAPVSRTSKWWLEQIIQNNVYRVEREKVPFILHM